MPYHKRISSTRLPALLLVLCLGTSAAGLSAQSAAEAAPAPSLTVSQVNRLVERGALSKKDAADLLLMAEADAAEARAQAAMMQAQLAQAEAALARAKAVAAQASHTRSQEEPAVETHSPARTAAVVAAELDEPAPARSAPTRSAPVPVAVAAATNSDDAPAASAESAENPPAAPVMAQAASPARAPAASSTADATDEKVPDDTVRVTYVPEVVKEQLREEIKADVIAQARAENWVAPNTMPDWVTRFRLFGDVRVRAFGMFFPAGNDNTGAFPNFNAINTGAPFDVAGTVFSPQYNVDQDRTRLQLRTRLGAAMDLGQGVSAGLRFATGENDSPVTQNQGLGVAGSGQGGNFSKYAVWLDRGFLRYETGGLPDNDFTFSLGRFDNPFFKTTAMIWADDLGFDGAVAEGKFPLGEDVTPFYVVGAFPVFNTDLNFASNQPAKFKSDDKWLYATQLGVTVELTKDLSLKVGGAYYYFQNIEGKLSTPYVPLTASDAGDTDSSRPAFAQVGNTYMALRDIIPTPGDASAGGNQNGTINQFQYYGLATKFQELAFDARLDYNAFEPFQVSLVGEWVKNRSFNSAAIAAKAVNNLGADGKFLGSDTAWIAGLILGHTVLAERWDWNVSFNYRKVGSDSVVDGFSDSDFANGGTNFKGYTIAGNVALSARVWIGLRWMSATQVAGPTFKNDIIQLDFNGKF
jgi:hypothetical protein